MSGLSWISSLLNKYKLFSTKDSHKTFDTSLKYTRFHNNLSFSDKKILDSTIGIKLIKKQKLFLEHPGVLQFLDKKGNVYIVNAYNFTHSNKSINVMGTQYPVYKIGNHYSLKTCKWEPVYITTFGVKLYIPDEHINGSYPNIILYDKMTNSNINVKVVENLLDHQKYPIFSLDELLHHQLKFLTITNEKPEL